jgi:pyroglutamyl-peptidase
VKIAKGSERFDPHGETPAGPIVVTAFEPFAGRRRNRSWEVLRRLDAGSHVVRARLPVDFERIHEEITDLVALSPRAVLLLGEFRGHVVRVETIALNVLHSSTPDNAGRVVSEARLIPDAPLALDVRSDSAEIVARIGREGIPTALSHHAGTYACNAALYHSLNLFPPETPIAFLHLPRRGWPLGPSTRKLIRSVEIALAALGLKDRHQR